MSRDIYPALTGAAAVWEQLNQVSQNLANVNTTGYKALRVPFENHMATEGILGDSFVKLGEEELDRTTGSIVSDGIDTHFALKGKGFFVVEGADGETLLMRSGAFQFDSERNLVNHLGERVIQNGGGYIQLDQDQTTIQVADDGTIFSEDGDEIGQFMILDSDDLTPLNGTRFRPGDMVDVTGQTAVIQGSIELSNADPFREMTSMIQTTRLFETLQKTMQSSNELDNKLNQMTRRSS